MLGGGYVAAAAEPAVAAASAATVLIVAASASAAFVVRLIGFPPVPWLPPPGAARLQWRVRLGRPWPALSQATAGVRDVSGLADLGLADLGAELRGRSIALGAGHAEGEGARLD